MAEYRNFTDNIITFVRGNVAKYNNGIAEGKYTNDIYFATDQRTIFANGVAYGLTEEERELLTTLGTTLVKAEMTKPGTFTFTDNLGLVTTLSLDVASDTVTGLMSAEAHSKLSGIEAGAEVNIIESISTDSEEIKLTGWNENDENAEIVIPAITIENASESNNRITTIKLQDTLSKFAAKDAVYTRKEVEDRIKTNVTAAYKVMGSLTNAELVAMSLEGHEVGEVYNMTTAGTVTTVGGEGASATLGDDIFPAGSNFVIVDFNGALAWDALAGNFDTAAIEEELRLANIAIQANKDAIDAEVLRATAAEKVNADEIADIWEKLGEPALVIDENTVNGFPPAAADQTVQLRIDKLYFMLGELDMDGMSWAEFILNITDAKYVQGGDGEIGTDGISPTLAQLDAIADASGYKGLIDSYVDVAKLIKELITADKVAAQDLAKEIQDRKDADSALELAYKAADDALQLNLEQQLSDAKLAIDNYTINTKKISTNPVLNGNDIEITGYSKMDVANNTQEVLAEDDTVNEAVAKLEKNIALAVAGQTSGLEEVRGRLDLIEEDLNTDAGITAKPNQGLLEIVEGLVGNGEGSVQDQIEDALDVLKDGNDGTAWDNMEMKDDAGTVHDNTLSGLKAYVDAQDDAHLGAAKTYTDNEIAKALTWYEAD